MKKHKDTLQTGFTLNEILIAISIVLFLGSIATVAYQKLLDHAREAVCTTNVKALTTAVEAYALENDALPAVLGDLEPRHVQKAYAAVWAESSPWVKLAYRMVALDQSNIAYANFFKYRILKDYGASKKMFRCPNDKNEGVSYGINRRVKNMKWHKVKDDAIIVGDCESRTFGSEDELDRRHQKKTVAVAATKNKKVKKRKKRSSGEKDLALSVSVEDTDGDGDVDAND
jgi:prepilin-type N-terminal cleavage/methylation domain-containing protein